MHKHGKTRRLPNARRAAAIIAAVGILGAACSSDDDSSSDSAAASEVEDGSDSASASDSASSSGSSSASGTSSGSGSGSSSGSASGSGSGSSSASAPAEEELAATPGDGGYDYASNVDSHRLVVDDVCLIKDLLDVEPIDYDEIETIYRDGVNSVNSDGSIRAIGGFASRDDRSHGHDVFYGEPTPLDDFVSAAITGTGMFEGTSDAVRAQGIEKGIQNMVMIAWVVHELNVSNGKAAEANFDIQTGAVHNWDEGWAFYHGASSGCAPFATADSRAGNFGTTGEGDTAQANEAILAAMIEGRDALLAEDTAGAETAAAEVIRNVAITYSQAVIRYGSLVIDDLAADDIDEAEKHRAEGLAFWRVIEPYIVPAGADGDVINAIFALDGELGANGGAPEIRAALQPAWDTLGISAEDIGMLESESGAAADDSAGDAGDAGDEGESAGGGNVVDVGAANGASTITTFASFAPGFNAAVTGPGPVTYLAPNDAALAAIQTDAPELVAELSSDFELLDALLQYHVIDGAALAEDVIAVTELTAIDGSTITVEVIDGTVVLNGGQATVVQTALLGSNGVVHIIDGVLLPPSLAGG